MADLHIEDFNRDVAKIFLHLYASFPRKIVLYVEDISGPDQPDEFGLHHPRFDACFSTMIWLAEEGYIRFESTVAREALDQAVLSERAYLLLSSRSQLTFAQDVADALEPASVADSLSSNVAQLRATVKSASSIHIKQCVHYLLSSQSRFKRAD